MDKIDRMHILMRFANSNSDPKLDINKDKFKYLLDESSDDEFISTMSPLVPEQLLSKDERENNLKVIGKLKSQNNSTKTKFY